MGGIDRDPSSYSLQVPFDLRVSSFERTIDNDEPSHVVTLWALYRKGEFDEVGEGYTVSFSLSLSFTLTLLGIDHVARRLRKGREERTDLVFLFFE